MPACGITFVLLFVLDGAWTYTDALADLAQGHTGGTCSRAPLFGALQLGATSLQRARCLSGGALMGWASLMIPGGNDSLVLVAMPLLRPYAWVAFAAMSFAIGAASLSCRLLRAHRQRESRRLA